MRLLLLSLILVTGCGGGEPAQESRMQAALKMKDKTAGDKDDRAEKEAAPTGARERKIEYRGTIEIIVEDFGKSMEELTELVVANKGYVAQSDITNSPGEARRGHWTLRIPVARFDPMREAIGKLGETQKNTTDSEDVTEEFYDLQAHIKNKKEEEAGLQKLFQASAGKLEDILKVRAELTQVRTEIDRLEGRLSALTQLTALTTLDVYLHDRHTYVPLEAATYGTAIERTFFGSIDLLVRFGKGAFLVIVAISPWLPLIAVISMLVWLVVRRSRRVSPSPPVPAGPSPSLNPEQSPGL
jgi:Domain of unknown function (DUF4349)